MKWGDPEYFVRPLGHHAYSVIKYSDSVVPDATYTVRYESCTCPVGFDCKHVRLVKAYKERGEPEGWTWTPTKNGGSGGWTGRPIRAIRGYNP